VLAAEGLGDDCGPLQSSRSAARRPSMDAQGSGAPTSGIRHATASPPPIAVSDCGLHALGNSPGMPGGARGAADAVGQRHGLAVRTLASSAETTRPPGPHSASPRTCTSFPAPAPSLRSGIRRPPHQHRGCPAHRPPVPGQACGLPKLYATSKSISANVRDITSLWHGLRSARVLIAACLPECNVDILSKGAASWRRILTSAW
jgi:hypothetical protein